jgi:LytS/YehU family sensor histidine kinase
VWTAVGLLFSIQIYVDYTYAGVEIRWAQSLWVGLSEWYVWAGLSPLIFVTARRFPFGRRAWGRSIAVHLPATVAVALLKLAIHSPIAALAGVGPLRPPGLETFNISLLTCWLIVGVSHALIHYRSSQERTRQSLELRTQLSEAQLQLLKAQLQPHFLFNTLHSIGTLMHRDVEAAETMLVQLSDLFRLAIDNGDLQEVSLESELDFTRLYVAIQKTRFGDRLRVSFDVEPETLGARCPNMILQPLVENAIQHGVESATAGADVAIQAAREGDTLRISVLDNGPGLASPDARENGTGLGLSNTRARLAKLYGGEERLTLDDPDGGGLRVTLRIPFEV